MEEKLDAILNVISNIQLEISSMKDEIKDLKTRMDIMDKKIDKTAIELRVQISNVRDELKIDIKDAVDISVRQAMMVSEHCERLYQESKKDRQELHQSVDILSNAFQFNKMEIEKLKTKC